MGLDLIISDLKNKVYRLYSFSIICYKVHRSYSLSIIWNLLII